MTPSSKRLRILLEDEQAIADTLLYTLQNEGFDVTNVRLARDALAAFRAKAPDLAILDVGVPEGNGFDVCRAIRKTSGLVNCPSSFSSRGPKRSTASSAWSWAQTTT